MEQLGYGVHLHCVALNTHFFSAKLQMYLVVNYMVKKLETSVGLQLAGFLLLAWEQP